MTLKVNNTMATLPHNLASIAETEGAADRIYRMVTATLKDGEVHFPSQEAFSEAISVGFFRIKAPEEMDLKAGRAFARTFAANPRYNQFGVLDVVNGYLQSEQNQTVRFTLERDNWNKCHVNQKEVDGPGNYPPEVQKLGHHMHDIGIKVLKSILRGFEIPEELWFEATGGSSHGEGSHFLLFNCYDPKNGAFKPHGVAPHKDWGHLTVLDATEPGLEAEINGSWKSIFVEDGYLTINFGYPLEKLLPGVKASNHRVVTQTGKMRTSTVAFIDPRVGPYRKHLGREDVGMVYDLDESKRKLVNGESTVSFFTRLSELLYGHNQSGKASEYKENI
jgi:2-oxoglutarate-Fe(II)-dependent oxygenase superfamily protein